MVRWLIHSVLLAALVLLILFAGCSDDGPVKVKSKKPVQPNFTKTSAFGTGISRAAAWGDYDGDTDLDLAVGNDGQNFLYTNNGDGTYTEAMNFGALTTGSLLWMNTDGDSDIDLIVGNEGQNFIYVNEGGGVFSESAALGGGNSSGLAHGDLDGDTDEDIVVANWASGETSIYLNSGSNNFVFDRFLHPAISAAVFDVDEDNDLDVVLGVGCCMDSSLVYTNNGSGDFSLHSSFGSTKTEMTNFSLSDYDNDGDIDIISGCGDNGGEALGLWIYENDGAGYFVPAVMLVDTIFFSHVEFGDVDGDSDEDVVVGTLGFFQDRLAVFYNNNGIFSKTVIENGGTSNFPLNGAIDAIILTDVDKDSDVDIAVFCMDWVSEFVVQPAQNLLYLNEGP